METIKLNQKEKAFLLQAHQDTLALSDAIRNLIDQPEESKDYVWDLKNKTAEIEAVLYNVHHGVYRS